MVCGVLVILAVVVFDVVVAVRRSLIVVVDDFYQSRYSSNAVCGVLFMASENSPLRLRPLRMPAGPTRKLQV